MHLFEESVKKKKQTYIKYKATEQFDILDKDELMEFEDGTTVHFEMYDNITEFIGNYEESMTKKKLSMKPKGIEKFMDE